MKHYVSAKRYSWRQQTTPYLQYAYSFSKWPSVAVLIIWYTTYMCRIQYGHWVSWTEITGFMFCKHYFMWLEEEKGSTILWVVAILKAENSKWPPFSHLGLFRNSNWIYEYASVTKLQSSMRYNIGGNGIGALDLIFAFVFQNGHRPPSWNIPKRKNNARIGLSDHELVKIEILHCWMCQTM